MQIVRENVEFLFIKRAVTLTRDGDEVNRKRNSELRGNICVWPLRVIGWALCSKAMVKCDRDRERVIYIYISPVRTWAPATRMERVYLWLALAHVSELRFLRAERDPLTLMTICGLHVTWRSEFQIACLHREKSLQCERNNTTQKTTALIRAEWLNYNWILLRDYGKCTIEKF